MYIITWIYRTHEHSWTKPSQSCRIFTRTHLWDREHTQCKCTCKYMCMYIYKHDRKTYTASLCTNLSSNHGTGTCKKECQYHSLQVFLPCIIIVAIMESYHGNTSVMKQFWACSLTWGYVINKTSCTCHMKVSILLMLHHLTQSHIPTLLLNSMVPKFNVKGQNCVTRLPIMLSQSVS